MALPWFALAPLAISVVFSTAVRIEGRGRQSDDGTTYVADVEVAPSVAAVVRSKTFEIVGGYAPRLMELSIGYGPTFAALHRWGAGAKWHGRGVELTLDESGTDGTTDFAGLVDNKLALPGTEGAPALPRDARVDTLPPARVVEYFSNRATLAGNFLPAHRWRLRTAVAYSINGGVNATAQQSIPLQQGPEADVRAYYAATRSDALGTVLTLQHVSFSAGATVGPATYLAELGESWVRQLGRRLELELGAGIAGVSTQGNPLSATSTPTPALPVTPEQSSVHPAARVRLTWRAVRDRSGQLDFDLLTHLSPVADRTTGVVDQRVQGELRATYAPTGSIRLGLSGGAAQSVRVDYATVPAVSLDAQGRFTPALGSYTPAAMTLVRGEIFASYRATPLVTIEAGARAAWQDQSGTTATPLGGFLALTVSAPPISVTVAPVSHVRPPARPIP